MLNSSEEVRRRAGVDRRRAGHDAGAAQGQPGSVDRRDAARVDEQPVPIVYDDAFFVQHAGGHQVERRRL